MCIGLPMRVLRVQGAWAQVAGRGREETVDLRLVGNCAPGEWLLVFQGAAREKLEPQRAAEIDAALDLLEQAQHGTPDLDADPGFALPSSMSAEMLAALAGKPTH